MHAAAQNLRGGVSPRGTLLRGQSIIEYVLIAAVIGPVIVFAGPSVAGAIRNQFNQVTNTVDSGTGGDNFISVEEKAYREAMKTVASKEAKDWTLDEQKAAATDIAKNGTSSVVYAKAKAAMDAGTTWSVKLTDGKTLEYRIIGINHDDLADGSGRAGLTFLGKGIYGARRINHKLTNVGGWEKSDIRQEMNSGGIWNLMPTGFQSKVEAVTKMTDNKGGGSAAAPTATTDKLFLLSTTEIYGNIQSDGVQYEYYKAKGVTISSYSDARDLGYALTRSVNPSDSSSYRYVEYDGSMGYMLPVNGNICYPAWCF